MGYQFGLIGYPIKHSLSPWIHEQFLTRTNLQGTYSVFEMNPNDEFSEQLALLRKKDLNGFNVTVPFKEKVIPYLDSIDIQAERIGAVNTVLCQNGKWIGYNTDGIGYVRSLVGKFPQLNDNKQLQILILGAGGAAKGIFHALIDHGFHQITLANRSREKAEQLTKNEPSGQVISLEEAENTIANYDLLIQTTSVGMKPNVDDSIITIKDVKKGAIASDIVYQPLVTSFLKQAHSKQAALHFGHTMLLYQAQYAFEIWTGRRPEMNDLDSQLQTILEG